jgi:hypothetical protein
MKHSIAEFQERFGSKGLGSSDACYLDFLKATCIILQIIRLLGQKIYYAYFDTIEEVCQQFFDTSTLAEAILGYIGIPRLVILNGYEKPMLSSGWTYKGKCTLGDKSVQVGSRISLAIEDTTCSHCIARCAHGNIQNFWGEN